MERFNSIYTFTTENIAGYMNELDLTNKSVITVTGSSDHIINCILKGCTIIKTFDINPLTKYYMDLKLSAIKELSYQEFLDFLLFDTDKSFSYDIIHKLNMDCDSKKFWLNELEKNNNDGKKLKESGLFNLKYFDYQNKIDNNLYLNKENYDIIKERLGMLKISFIKSDLKDLVIDCNYDYMFLSNISDYLEYIFHDNYLSKYKKLIFSFLKNVKVIYFAYVYDINNGNRSMIDDLELVKKVFGKITIKVFKSALINCDTQDGVLIKEEK
jgi:S-adenosylmethionine:diacylglycerol 3-amino-3-carboxypropyl transferase